MVKKRSSFAWGALAGGIIGSVTALLLAPKSGRELRSDIGDYAVKAADAASGLGEKIGDKAVSAARQTAAGASALKGKAIQTADSLASGIKFWDRGQDRELAAMATASANLANAEEYASSIGELDEALTTDETSPASSRL